MPGAGRRPRDLREACVEEARRIIAEQGLEQLSLREVARRLGVSHQAPYRHFPSREHLLAELIAREFRSFAQALGARPAEPDPSRDLGGMGRAYLAYAREHELSYRLMFDTAVPEPAQHPVMVEAARHAFALLAEALGRMPLRPRADGVRPTAALDALFVWATMHGLASILFSHMLAELGLTPAEVAAAPEHVLARIGTALRPDPLTFDHGPASKASADAGPAVSRASRRKRDASKPPRPAK